MRPATTHLERATVAVAAGHLALALLTAIDRAGYGGRPAGLIGSAADHPLWVLAHLTAALALLAAVATGIGHVGAHITSVGALAGWSVLMGAWAMQLDPNATWAVAILGFALAAVSFALSGLWADRE